MSTPRYGERKYGAGTYGPGNVLDRWQLQMELAGAGNGWTDVTADVRAQDAVACEYGIQGDTPLDRVASTGSLTFALDNSASNSGGVIGYYAPFHASKRSGFTYDIGVRWVLRHRAVDYYKFRGKLAGIDVVPGVRGPRLTRCQVLDYLDELARMPVPDLAAQTSKRADQLITTLLAALATQPPAQSLETGVDTFTWALDGGTGQGLMAREELAKIALSEQGYVYQRGDTTQGGTLVFEARGHRSLNPTTRLTLNNTMVGCTVAGSRDELYGRVRVIVYPTRVDAAATTVLFSLNSASTLIEAGATIDTIFGPYRDPETNEPCGGTEMVSPVATTDYTMNSAADGSGTNLTANFTVSASYTGQGVRYTITNTGGTAGYITLLQARGKGVYRSRVAVEQTVSSGGDRVLELDLPYQTSINAANNIALQLAAYLSTERARVQSVTFYAQDSETLLEAAINREPGDRIAITETATGLDGDLFTIQSVRLELRPPGHLWCTWGLVPWGLDPWWAPDDFAATGGTVATADGYTTHTFTSNGTFQVTAGADPVTVEYLIVGGGGGGGGDDIAGAAGGGAGGQVVTGSVSVSVGSYSVTVGTGGAGGAQVTTSTGSAGTASTFNGVSAAGGSGGAGSDKAAGGATLGGGGGSDGTPGTGSLYSGGSGATNAGGGGAGAGGAGSSAVSGTGGNGGPGVTSSISGSAVSYGGGGGGGGLDAGGTASAGGGAGRSGNGAGSNGTANRGGGGGGARFGGAGGNGGSGVVIIRYPTAV